MPLTNKIIPMLRVHLSLAHINSPHISCYGHFPFSHFPSPHSSWYFSYWRTCFTCLTPWTVVTSAFFQATIYCNKILWIHSDKFVGRMMMFTRTALLISTCNVLLWSSIKPLADSTTATSALLQPNCWTHYSLSFFAISTGDVQRPHINTHC